MRVNRNTHDENRAAILDAASSMFRRRGLDRVSVADVSREAGLTHGALYGHYPSKDALVEAACRASLAAGSDVWRRRAAEAREAGADGLEAIIAAYLSTSHRDHPGQGCALASLGQELARGKPELRQALDDGVAGLLDVLAEEIGRLRPQLAEHARTRVAQGVLAALAGGLIVARCTTDPVRSVAALRAAAKAALAASHVPED